MTNEWTSPDGRIRLINADCLDVRDSLPAVDCVLTDPPYGLGDGWAGGFNGRNGRSSVWPEAPPDWDKPELAAEMVAWCSQRAEAVIWGGNYYDLGTSRCWLAWDKVQSFSSADAELAWTNLDMPVRVFRMSRIDAHHNKADCKKAHPNQKPTQLFRWCLGFMDGELVLDPFAGVCTTAVACIKERRRCIAIEKERKYWEIGVQRCKDEYARTVLFNEAEAVA